VDVVPIYEGTGSIQEEVTRHLLNGHVIARERFFYGTAEADYELVASQNTPLMNQRWAAQWDRANPNSPINLYKDGTTVRVQIRSISFLKLGSGKEVAQVRFTKYARPGGTGDEQASHWISTIDFAYTKPSKDEKLRSMNALGFKVVEYQREPEVATQAAPKGGQ
jgi:type IV secretion system protein VirB8